MKNDCSNYPALTIKPPKTNNFENNELQTMILYTKKMGNMQHTQQHVLENKKPFSGKVVQDGRNTFFGRAVEN